MKIKKPITKKDVKLALSLLFSFSTLSINNVYAETKHEKSAYSSEYKNAISQVLTLQTMVETYSIDYNDKYPLKVSEIKKLKIKTLSSSTGAVSTEDLFNRSLDYSDYERSTDKTIFKNKVVYKPLNISTDKLFALGYELYFTDDKGNLSKDMFCNGEGCKDNYIGKRIDNFSNPDGYTDSRGYNYFAIQSEVHKKPDYNEIISRSLDELKKGNKTQQIYFNLIMGYTFTKNAEKAKQTALDFVKDFPNSAEAYNLLAYNYNGEKEIELRQKAVSLNPKNPSYRYDLADSYVSNKNYDKALVEYQKVNDEYPGTFSDLDEKIDKTKKLLQTK